jgi:hypothetical protein
MENEPKTLKILLNIEPEENADHPHSNLGKIISIYFFLKIND